MADLQFYETRPATQADIDRLIRHDVVLRAIDAHANKMTLAPFATIRKLIEDMNAIDQKYQGVTNEHDG